MSIKSETKELELGGYYVMRLTPKGSLILESRVFHDLLDAALWGEVVEGENPVEHRVYVVKIMDEAEA